MPTKSSLFSDLEQIEPSRPFCSPNRQAYQEGSLLSGKLKQQLGPRNVGKILWSQCNDIETALLSGRQNKKTQGPVPPK